MTIYISELLNMNVGVTIGGAGSGLSWKVVSSNTSAESGNGYIVNTNSGEISITLPGTPEVGDQVGISDYNSGFLTNNCVLLRNGNKIMGLSEDFVCDVDNMSIMIVYADASQGWKILYGV